MRFESPDPKSVCTWSFVATVLMQGFVALRCIRRLIWGWVLKGLQGALERVELFRIAILDYSRGSALADNPNIVFGVLSLSCSCRESCNFKKTVAFGTMTLSMLSLNLSPSRSLLLTGFGSSENRPAVLLLGL